MKTQRVCLLYQPTVGHALRKAYLKASALSCPSKRTLGFLLPSGRRIFRRRGSERSVLTVLATPRSTSALIPLMNVVRWDGTSEDINQTLVAAFEAKDYLDCIKNLRAQNIDPLSYIDNLDKVGSYLIPRYRT